MDREGLVVSAVNFSEGRRKSVIDEIVGQVPEPAKVLDVHSDGDHNRTVMTVAGDVTSIETAVIEIATACTLLIDLSQHQGAHPRMGALDVVPFVPTGPLGFEVVVASAIRVGKGLAENLYVPCFLYELASESRSSLPEVRRSAFKSRRPDFGPQEPHPTAGATCIGARDHLVAFNVELHTSDLEVARGIARQLRQHHDGNQPIRSLAIPLSSKGTVQVSMNLVDPLRVTPRESLRKVERLAELYGIEVGVAEIVGLPPSACLVGIDDRLMGGVPKTSLEDALEEAFGAGP